MKLRVLLLRLAILLALVVVGALGHHFGGTAHIRRRLGQPPLASTACFTCHFVSTDRLRWAQPRPHHDAPAGVAVSPDGRLDNIAPVVLAQFKDGKWRFEPPAPAKQAQVTNQK